MDKSERGWWRKMEKKREDYRGKKKSGEMKKRRGCRRMGRKRRERPDSTEDWHPTLFSDFCSSGQSSNTCDDHRSPRCHSRDEGAVHLWLY